MKEGEGDHEIKINFSELPSLKGNAIFQNQHISYMNSFSVWVLGTYEYFNLQKVKDFTNLK